jgi:ribosomal protein S18 acetylase RimI-like enzyme
MRTLALEVAHDNTRAQSFYARLGFVCVEERATTSIWKVALG